MSNLKTIWVCGACGRYGPTRRSVGDESCYLNAIECWPSSLIFRDRDKLVRWAMPVTETWVECPAAPTPFELALRARQRELRMVSPARVRRVARRAARRAQP